MSSLIRNTALFAACLLIAASAQAHLSFDDPMTAALETPRVQKELLRLEEEAFVLMRVGEIPILYLVVPHGDYLWGSVVFKLLRSIDGTFAVDYCDVDAEITVTAKGCYVSKLTTVIFTVA